MMPRDDWAKVDGIEMRLVTGEQAKAQMPNGQGRAALIARITRPGRKTTVPVILRYSRRKVDVLAHHIVWVAHR